MNISSILECLFLRRCRLVLRFNRRAFFQLIYEMPQNNYFIFKLNLKYYKPMHHHTKERVFFLPMICVSGVLYLHLRTKYWFYHLYISFPTSRLSIRCGKIETDYK